MGKMNYVVLAYSREDQELIESIADKIWDEYRKTTEEEFNAMSEINYLRPAANVFEINGKTAIGILKLSKAMRALGFKNFIEKSEKK